MSNTKFNTRGFVALLTTFTFVVMVITGVVLYIEPHGRVAYWTNWRLLGLGKNHWDGIHIVTSFVFLIAAGFHTYFNWKQLVRYLSGKVREGLRQWRELGIAAAIVTVSVVGAAASWIPFSWLLDLNDMAKSSWATDASENPPFGHAEMVSLASLSQKLGLDENKAVQNLEDAGMRVDGTSQTVVEVAEQNGVPPQEVFRIMQQDNATTRRGGRGLGNGTGRGLGNGTGRGLGNGTGRGRGSGAAPVDEGRPAPEGSSDEMEEHEEHHDHAMGEGEGRNRAPGGRGLHGGRRGGGRMVSGSEAAKSIFDRYSGRGLGKRTIGSLCAELGISAEDGVASLAAQGITASAADPIRSVAVEHKMRPAAVIAAMCKGGGCE